MLTKEQRGYVNYVTKWAGKGVAGEHPGEDPNKVAQAMAVIIIGLCEQHGGEHGDEPLLQLAMGFDTTQPS